MSEDIPRIETKEWFNMKVWMNTDPWADWKRLVRQPRSYTFAFIEEMRSLGFEVEVQPGDNKRTYMSTLRVRLPTMMHYSAECLMREDIIHGVCVLAKYFTELSFKPDEGLIYASGG